MKVVWVKFLAGINYTFFRSTWIRVWLKDQQVNLCIIKLNYSTHFLSNFLYELSFSYQTRFSLFWNKKVHKI